MQAMGPNAPCEAPEEFMQVALGAMKPEPVVVVETSPTQPADDSPASIECVERVEPGLSPSKPLLLDRFDYNFLRRNFLDKKTAQALRVPRTPSCMARARRSRSPSRRRVDTGPMAPWQSPSHHRINAVCKYNGHLKSQWNARKSLTLYSFLTGASQLGTMPLRP